MTYNASCEGASCGPQSEHEEMEKNPAYEPIEMCATYTIPSHANRINFNQYEFTG